MLWRDHQPIAGVHYLRGLYQGNRFADVKLLGHTLKLSDVDVPLMAITCEADRIAASNDCYRGVHKM